MKMTENFFLLLFTLLFATHNFFAQETISSGELSITLLNTGKGVKIVSMKKNDTELLDTEALSALFLLQVDNKFITSASQWDSVKIQNNGSDCIVVLSHSTLSISKDLTVTVTISTDDKKSEWDISVTKLGNSTLKNTVFPYLNIKANGNDYFFLPKYSGKLVVNPKAKGINSTLTYPRGWSVSMQYVAYYNNDYGIYFGAHDPTAAKKDFTVRKNIFNGIKYQIDIPAPNMGVAGNDWEFPGVLRIELFDGNWYEASQIYKAWASKKAEYWPQMTPERIKRQQVIGNIPLWLIFSDVISDSKIISYINRFKDSMNVPVGMHWYRWNNKTFDDDYPFFFPERDGMDKLVSELQKNNDVFCMPYTNGRLFDKDLPNYDAIGYPGATKNENGEVYGSVFNGNNFAIMCPTYKPYQDIMEDASSQITTRIGCAAVYIDQVCASTVIKCMDPSHGHTLGGGAFWRDGYNEMFEKIHGTIGENKFVTVEGGVDYLADEVDGFLTDGWQTDNMVPAFQAVYSGKVQTFGTRTGTGSYNNQSFYCRLAQTFVYGTIPGRFYTSLVSSSSARSAYLFVKKIANLRYKLTDYMSFGEMLKPVDIDRSGIPTITSTWIDYGTDIPVTISALQSSFWKNKDETKVAVVFANASMSQTLNFTFDFDGNAHGVYGKLQVQKITANSNGSIKTEENSFSKNVSIPPMEVMAYIIEPDSMLSDIKEITKVKTYSLEQNYPNPFNPDTQIDFYIPVAGNTDLEIYNVLGQKVATLVNRKLQAGSYSFRFNAGDLPSGVYIYRLQSKTFSKVKKMLLIK